MAANIEKFDFDPEKLRQKYREERDKRLRSDGNDQYKEKRFGAMCRCSQLIQPFFELRF